MDAVPDDVGLDLILHWAAELITRQRKHLNGPEQVIKMRGCGFSARDIRDHLCELKPPRRKELRATKEQAAAYKLGARAAGEVHEALAKAKAAASKQ